MEKTIILCTASYPFGYGETFLEVEVPILANHFDTIYILPDDINHNRRRETPENVRIIYPKEVKTTLLYTVYKCLRTKPFRNEFFKNIFILPQRNKVLLRSLQKAFNKKKNIQRTLHQKENVQWILYSYWLDHSAIAIALIKKPCVKVSRIHGWDIYETRHKYNYLPLRPFLFQKIKIFSISKHGIHYSKIRYPVAPHIALSRLGVPATNSYPSSLASFTKMISVSSLIPLKRVEKIKEALDSTQSISSILEWQHYGSGPLYERLFSEKPNIFKGQVTHEEIIRILKREKDHSFLINVSEYEGIPMSMMEAMSYGIPCIGTDVGGVSEIIHHGYNGYLLTPNPTINEIIITIEKLLNLSETEALDMRIAAFKTWQEKYEDMKNYTDYAEELALL